VARIAFPYGPAGRRPGLAQKMAQRFEQSRRDKKPVKLFSDQIICPSYIPDIHLGLARIAEDLLAGRAENIYHLTGRPSTPLEFGGLVRSLFGFEDVAVEPVSAEGTLYPRNLCLSHEKTCRLLRMAMTPHADALRAVKGSPQP